MNTNDRRLDRIKSGLREIASNPQLLSIVDRVVFALIPGRGSDAGRHVLIAPPGGGNIGDQAMVEAFLDNTDGEVVIVVRDPREVSVPPAHAARVRVLALTSLVYGGLPRRLVDIVAYRRLLRGARSVAVVGADIMDGAYNPRASVNRANLARLARRAGVDARVLGFSWNGRAHPQARHALRAASRAGTQLLLRDPVSAARARADGLMNVVDAADTVFSARTVDQDTADRLLASVPADTRIALVNASGLVGESVSQVEEYVAVIHHLRQRGLKVVLLPHVVRPGADDMVVCREIHKALADPDIILVERVLGPAAIRGLTARATLVITGRMHLAIMSFYSGAPAITLATQGKVEGLMQLFGTEALCIDPCVGFGARIIAVADDVLDRIEEVRDHIAARLPLVTERSRLNYAYGSQLPQAGAATFGYR